MHENLANHARWDGRTIMERESEPGPAICLEGAVRADLAYHPIAKRLRLQHHEKLSGLQ